MREKEEQGAVTVRVQYEKREQEAVTAGLQNEKEEQEDAGMWWQAITGATVF